jgi:Domain of unknown function (DUF4158)
MPVEYLTEEQEQRYGRYIGEPSREQLARYVQPPRRRSSAHCPASWESQSSRLWDADRYAQIPGHLSWLSRSISWWESLRMWPPSLVLEPTVYRPLCGTRPNPNRDHAQEIRQHNGYKEFSDCRGGFALMRFLYARAWVGTERPSVLFDLTTAWLTAQKSPVAWRHRPDSSDLLDSRAGG